MSPALRRLCPTCKVRVITHGSQCPACRRVGELRRRAKVLDFYNSRRWRRFRSWFLAGHPLCVACERQGQITPASDVDHIERLHAGNLHLAFEESACQALCHRHHSAKTASETWRGK
jgi:5-methylcytosine-specific restriction protein A